MEKQFKEKGEKNMKWRELKRQIKNIKTNNNDQDGENNQRD